MRITVLGKSPSWQDAGGACSGYLIEDGETSLLLDCGNGVFSKLRRYRDYGRVDAVVISHLHADHFLDLVPYAYALALSPRRQAEAAGEDGGEAPPGPYLYAPHGATAVFRRVAGAWGSEELIEGSFRIEGYDASTRLEVGSLRLGFRPVPHFVETYAIRLESATGGGRLVFGADSGPGESLVEAVHGADLLLLEATQPRAEPGVPRGHLTPREAGEHAAAAGARRLVLTHLSDEIDAQWARKEAAAAFGGPVETAREGAVYHV